MDKIYLCKVEFVDLVENYNEINADDSQYNDGIKHGLELGIRGLARALNINVHFDGKQVNYDNITLNEE
jgi:hypothetical protein